MCQLEFDEELLPPPRRLEWCFQRELFLGLAKPFEQRTSPTGFPFKVVQLSGTLSDTKSVPRREHRCNLGYLRHTYCKADGTTGYRCPAEPVDDYIRKGGTLEETMGRESVCNGLIVTIDLAQMNSENVFDLPLVTAAHLVFFSSSAICGICG